VFACPDVPDAQRQRIADQTEDVFKRCSLHSILRLLHWQPGGFSVVLCQTRDHVTSSRLIHCFHPNPALANKERLFSTLFPTPLVLHCAFHLGNQFLTGFFTYGCPSLLCTNSPIAVFFSTKIKMSTSTQTSSPFSSASSPHSHSCSSFLTHYYTEKLLNVADIKYEESYMRTPMPDLTWKHDEPAHVSSVVEGWELFEGEVVLESIEAPDENFGMIEARAGEEGNVWGDGKREWIGMQEPPTSKKRSFNSDNDDCDSPNPKKPCKHTA
jgi:hypothetical protein